MSSFGVQENEWELSKENIQPLRQGRKVAALTDALDESHHRLLSIQKHEFEMELRTYSGDDPLDIWYRYACWIEQNFPKGGKDGNLKKLLDSCFTTLSSPHYIDKYKNDKRYLELWIKYANQSPSPCEIFQILFSKEYCTELAKFYEAWSWELERVKNFRKANTIYLEGIKKEAKPLDELEINYRKFQARVAQHLIMDDDGTQIAPDNEVNRSALSSLRTKGSKSKAPIERIDGSVLGPAGTLTSQFSKPNASEPKFQIFQDENAFSRQSLPLAEKSSLLPNKIVSANKENTKDPSVWSKKKLTQKSVPVIHVEDVHKMNQPNFKLHVDATVSDNLQTPSKPQVSGVLSVKKEEEWIVPLFIPEEYNPLQQPQYCKNKVYCGTEEFSFEELRAAKELEKEKERLKEEERVAMRDELQSLKDLVLQQQNLIYELKNKIDSTDKRQASKTYEDSWLAINKSLNATQNNSRGSSNNLNDSTKLLFNPPTAEMLKLSLLANESLNPGMQSALAIPTFDATNQSIVRGATAPSPTVNTKIAKQMISDMLSGSLFHRSNSEKSLEVKFVQEDNDSSQQNQVDKVPPATTSSTPFTIFCDENSSNIKKVPTSTKPLFAERKSLKPLETSSPEPIKENMTDAQKTVEGNFSSQPFMIYCDENSSSKAPSAAKEDFLEVKENIPPANYTVPEKRKTLGVLEPSVGIPVLPQEKERQHQVEENLVECEDMTELIRPPDDDFTCKIPTDLTFAQFAKVTSTPAMRNFISDIRQDDDTLPLPLIKKDASIVESEKHPSDVLHEGNSDELMPPPPPTVSVYDSHSDSIATNERTCATTCKTQALSPIFEASREYGSSSSDSSSGTLISNSNIHGLTQIAPHGAANFTSTSSHFGRRSTAPSVCGSMYDATKSGYFADRSENSTTNKSCNKRKRTDSFDPDKIAAALLLSDDESPAEAVIMKEPDNNCHLLDGPLNYPGEIDPFSRELQECLLSSLKNPVNARAGFIALNTKMPQIKANSSLCFGTENFFDCKLRGSGSYAKIYQVATTDPMNVTTLECYKEETFEKSHMILKVQRPPAIWEFYICCELRDRLKKDGDHHLLNSFTRVNRGYFFDEGSILVSTYHKYGTLLNIVNGYKQAGKSIPQSVVIYYMLQLLILIDKLHSCEIIHGDMKPDNILIVDKPKALSCEEEFLSSDTCIKLIDFGRSIDMKLLPKNSSFLKKVKTDGFQCCEMRDGRAWNYQTDLYGLAAVAHCLLWGSYMNVKKDHNIWKISGVNYQRNWDKKLWQTFFSKMLNVPSCSELPSLKLIIKSFCEVLFSEGNMMIFSSEIHFLSNIINEGK